MKKYILLSIILLVTNICIGQITFFACATNFTSSPNEYSFVLEGVDATGRNYYQTNPIDGAQSCAAGVCEFRIAWSASNSRWEVLLFQNNLNFSDATVVYHNSNAATPNPPSLNLGSWLDTTGSCGGTLNAGNSTFTGDIQDTTLGIDTISKIANELLVYPNPATNKVFVRYKNESIKKVIIYSTLGHVLLNENAVDEIDVSALSKGMYVISITTNSDRRVQQRIIIN